MAHVETAETWPPLIWDELDRPIKYAIRGSGSRSIIVPVKVWSHAPNWNGVCLARTLTLLDNPSGTQIDYRYGDIFETKEDAQKEIFLRKLKGK